MRKALMIGIVFLLAGCNLPVGNAGTPQLPAATVTAPPAVMPTGSPAPTTTATAVPGPTATSRPPQPPTASPTSLPPTGEMGGGGGALPHLSPGQPVVIRRLRMLDANHGWAIGTEMGSGDLPPQHVLRTADGGQTWQDVTPPVGEREMYLVAGAHFPDVDTAWVLYAEFSPTADSVPLWITTDGGATWQVAPLPVGEADQIGDSYFAVDGPDAWLLVTVGYGMSHTYSNLYHSADGGQTWEPLLTPMSDDADPLMILQHTGMAFRGGTGWVTKRNGVMDGVALVVSTDGGRSWALADAPLPGDASMCSTFAPTLFSPAEGYYLVVCYNYQHDTRQAYFAHWQNGVTHYTPLSAAVDTLVFFSPQQGLALGCADGTPGSLQCPILSTEDGGASWSLVKTVAWDGDFSFIDLLRGWAVAHNGDQIALVTTRNGGRSWMLLKPTIQP